MEVVELIQGIVLSIIYLWIVLAILGKLGERMIALWRWARKDRSVHWHGFEEGPKAS